MAGNGKKILFFGNERLATGMSTDAPILRALIADGYDIQAVIVAQKDDGPSRKGRKLEVAAVAEEHGIEIYAPGKLSESVEKLASYNVEAAVLVAFGKIVPKAVIDLFPKGIINIHPSLLPLHRGPTPLESVILKGDKQTGVSLMQLAPEMDAGPVFAQETVLLSGEETKEQLVQRLTELGRDMLLAHLPQILDGTLKPTPQNDDEATYDKLITKDDSELDFQKPAEQLSRKVRAYAGWPRTKTMVGEQRVIITRTHLAEGSGYPGALWFGDQEFGLYCSEGILVIDELIPEGRKPMSGHAFLAGYNRT